MVYLTRTELVKESKWKEAFEFMLKARDYVRKDPLVVQAEVLTGINGTLSRMYYVMAFNSLADEEKWDEKTMADPVYMALLEKSLALTVENSSEDNLFRSVP